MILVSCAKGQNLPLEQIQMDFKRRLSTQGLILMTSGLSIIILKILYRILHNIRPVVVSTRRKIWEEAG